MFQPLGFSRVMTPVQTQELEALLTQAETILNKCYLGTNHAKMQRIVDRALQVLKTEQVRTSTSQESLGTVEAQQNSLRM